ncbi:MAG: thioredoxin [Lachnospiraceae bacterium]|nr:thioredoxin [Lachnospiraceae bacterium]MEE1342539.1 thioredoxin [Lachnospiraceae bacterium]
MAYKFTDDNFKEEVLESEIPVLVDFFATWCGPCKMMGPIIEEVAKEYEGKVKIGKLDIDESPKTTQENRIVSVPTMILFKNGAKDDMRIGAIPREELKQWIEEAIS